MTDGQLLHTIKHLYTQNRCKGEEFSYTVPSHDTYPYQWLWDSCFESIVMSYFDLPQAKDELRSLASKQFKSGMLPHMIYWHRAKNLPQLDIKWGKHSTSSITQPPLLAQAVLKIYEADGDIDFVKEMLPHIHGVHKFLYRKRDPRDTCLVGLINPDESGEDTSPRFDEALKLGDRQTFEENYGARMELVDDWRQARFVIKKKMDLHYWVRDVPFNAILLESLSATARLAALCGESRMADWSTHKADSTAHAMKQSMKDDSGYFHSTMNYGEREHKISVRSWAVFMPLYAGLCTHDEAAELVRALHDSDDFGTFYGVPTISLQDASFNLDSVWPWPNWRGPIWLGANWFIVKGLRRYGYDKQADHIKKQSIELLAKSGFREFYNPFSGEGYGAKGFTWGGLVLDM